MSELISILMPSKNEGKYIEKAIKSILKQTYQNYELIIIDDSKDDTEKVIKSINSDKIIYRKVENSNISKSLNLALKLARGDIIARMDADDISHPDRLKIQYEYLMNHSDVHLVGSNFYFINDKGKLISKKKLPEYHEIIEYWMPILSTLLHATMMTYKEVLKSINGYTADIDRAEDMDLFLEPVKITDNARLISTIIYYPLR